MKFRIQVVCVTDDGAEQTRQVMEFERQELAMETLGMSLLEGKALLQGVQEFVSDQQAMEFLKRSQPCPHCGRQRSVKANGSIPVHTVCTGHRHHWHIWRISSGTRLRNLMSLMKRELIPTSTATLS